MGMSEALDLEVGTKEVLVVVLEVLTIERPERLRTDIHDMSTPVGGPGPCTGRLAGRLAGWDTCVLTIGKAKKESCNSHGSARRSVALTGPRTLGMAAAVAASDLPPAAVTSTPRRQARRRSLHVRNAAAKTRAAARTALPTASCQAYLATLLYESSSLACGVPATMSGAMM